MKEVEQTINLTERTVGAVIVGIADAVSVDSEATRTVATSRLVTGIHR